MTDSTMHIPVRATMRRQSDGSYLMADAEYAELSADSVARFLLERCGMPWKAEEPALNAKALQHSEPAKAW